VGSLEAAVGAAASAASLDRAGSLDRSASQVAPAAAITAAAIHALAATPAPGPLLERASRRRSTARHRERFFAREHLGQRERAEPEPGHRRAQLLDRALHASVGARLRDARCVGDLGVGQSVVEAQRERDAQVVG
jgi:hypothetical protein